MRTLPGPAAAQGGAVQVLGRPGWGQMKLKGHTSRCAPLPPPQDWKEQYIHKNYSRALEGEGLVEQVSPTRDS